MNRPDPEFVKAMKEVNIHNPVAVMRCAIEMFKEKNREYGNNYEYFGVMLKVLFPSGLKLETEGDFARASNLFNIISKLSRYCKNFNTGGHEDSAIDSIVYWAIQQELDNVENGEYADAAVEEAQRECSCGEEEKREEAKARDERKGERRGAEEIGVGFPGNAREGSRRLWDSGREARGRSGEDRRIRILRIRFDCRRKRTAGDRRTTEGSKADRKARPDAGV